MGCDKGVTGKPQIATVCPSFQVTGSEQELMFLGWLLNMQRVTTPRRGNLQRALPIAHFLLPSYD